MGDPMAACTVERAPEKAAPEMIPDGLSSDSDLEEDGGEQWLQSPQHPNPDELQMFEALL